MRYLILYRFRGKTKWSRWMLGGGQSDDRQGFDDGADAELYRERAIADAYEGQIQVVIVEVPA